MTNLMVIVILCLVLSGFLLYRLVIENVKLNCRMELTKGGKTYSELVKAVSILWIWRYPKRIFDRAIDELLIEEVIYINKKIDKQSLCWEEVYHLDKRNKDELWF